MDPTVPPGRRRMESRFGRPGAGARQLTVAGTAYSLVELMARLDLAFEGCRTIDGFAFSPDHFAVRFYDPEEQRIVAYEFDAAFRYLGESRVHIAEWIGDAALQEGFTGWIST
jgi:hypothetical protein